MAQNAVLRMEAGISTSNYILHPTPDHNYWVNLSSGRISDFVTRCGSAFNIVIVGSPDVEGDFYVIPYVAVKQALVSDYQSIDKTGRVRWVATIKNHQLRIGRYPISIDVGSYYGYDQGLTSAQHLLPEPENQNDFAIENRKIEIEQRQKQSLFRNRVLKNFEGQCCILSAHEDSLLVASHIVPWAKRIDSRLDPSNGLLLYCHYDRLFDQGFISFDDQLRVILTTRLAQCSEPLRDILQYLDGRQARKPAMWPIKSEYLEFHRSHVLQ